MPFTPIIGSLYLIYNPGAATWVRFVIRFAIGIVIYFLYSRSHSMLARGERDLPS